VPKMVAVCPKATVLIIMAKIRSRLGFRMLTSLVLFF
jgi:hypothetical protein